jgi:hypothetical protein
VRFVVAIDQDDNGNDRKVILTNEPMPSRVFTKLVTNPQLFDSQFVRALAAYLGHMVCMPLTNDLARAKYAFQIAPRASDRGAGLQRRRGLDRDRFHAGLDPRARLRDGGRLRRGRCT